MSHDLRILILEDDSSACNSLQEYAQTQENVTIVACTSSSSEALKLVTQTQPNAVIVDLELHNGSGNGLQFLSSVKQLQLSDTPYLLVTTNNPSQTTHEAVRSLGADFILTKYEDGYSAQYVIDFLQMMSTIIYQKCPVGSKDETISDFVREDSVCEDSVCEDSACEYINTQIDFETDTKTSDSISTETNETILDKATLEREILDFIRQDMVKIGINPKSIGYQYLIDAIYCKTMDKNANIYTYLGPLYNKCDTTITRSMQYAINRAWRVSDPNDLLTYYGARVLSDRGVPSVMEFIYFYASKTRTHFKNRGL